MSGHNVHNVHIHRVDIHTHTYSQCAHTHTCTMCTNIHPHIHNVDIHTHTSTFTQYTSTNIHTCVCTVYTLNHCIDTRGNYGRCSFSIPSMWSCTSRYRRSVSLCIWGHPNNSLHICLTDTCRCRMMIWVTLDKLHGNVTYTDLSQPHSQAYHICMYVFSGNICAYMHAQPFSINVPASHLCAVDDLQVCHGSLGEDYLLEG